MKHNEPMDAQPSPARQEPAVRPAAKLELNPLTLIFSGQQRRLEADFRIHHFDHRINQVRVALAVAILFYGSYVLFDMAVCDRFPTWFFIIRLGIVAPYLLAVIGLSYIPGLRRWVEPAVAVAVALTGAGMAAMSLMAPPDHLGPYLAGFIQIYIFAYTFLRARFVWVTPVIWSAVAIYAGISLVDQRPNDSIWMVEMMFLSGTTLLGMLACYVNEYYARRNFFLSRQLDKKQRYLENDNERLEQRVLARTEALLNINAQLRHEIEERLTTEQALTESQNRYRRIVDNVTNYICVHDLKGQILEVNRQFVSVLGYDRQQVSRMNLKQIVPEGHRHLIDDYLLRVCKNGRDSGLMTIVTRDGRKRIIEYSNVMATRASGPAVVYSSARDLTARRKAEKALRDSEERFRQIFTSVAAGIVIIDGDTQTIDEVNPAAADLIGLPPEKIKGRPCHEYICPTRHKACPVLTENKNVERVESVLVNDRAETIPILKTIHRIQLQGRDHLIESFVSIAQVKEAEAAKREVAERLRQAQNLQSIGTLAGGIAHDFNNILYGMMGFTELALDDAPAESVLRANLEEVLKGGHRAKDLIAQVLTFSRQDNSAKQAMSSGPLIKEAIKLLKASLPASIKFETHLDRNLEKIMANPTQIHQVMMNLCTNAAFAMKPDGGILQIHLKNKILKKNRPGHPAPVPKGDYVMLRVRDTGCGMPQAVLDRMFEPFFTTKAQGEGTGMGLSVVHGIVEGHGGYLQVTSKEGQGTVFEIFLPAVHAPEIVAEKHEPAIPGGNERVLLVDDESALIKMGQRILSGLGYKVSSFSDSTRALAFFKNAPQTVDLVITDLNMPRMGGLQLAGAMLDIRPDLPIVLCTGYGDAITVEKAAEAGIREFVMKPVLKSEMAVAIRRALAVN